jgi:hypothetical protein
VLTKFAADNGLSQIVNAIGLLKVFITLDLCFTSPPDLLKCSVVTASNVSDHS